jgi:site-specific recombinase XerD
MSMQPTVDVAVDPLALPPEAIEWLMHLTVERGRSSATISAYRRDLRAWRAFLVKRGQDLADATADDIVAYVGSLRSAGRAPATVARASVVLRGFYAFLVSEELSDSDPAADVEPPSVPKGLPKALGEQDVAALIDAVQGDDPIARRDRAVIEVLYGAGLRISELVGLSRGDVDLGGALLRVFGKGSKERIVPIGRLALAALEDWLDELGSPAREHGASSASTALGSASRTVSPRTCCGTPARPTCSTTERTFARCRNCSATLPSRPRRSTPRSRPNGCSRCTARRTRGRS